MGAAASQIVPGVLGIAGLMQGNSANRQANDAQAKQWELISRQIKAFDMLKGVVEGMDSGGAFNGDKRVEQIQKDQAQFEGRDLNNTAGALRIAGYQPGDTPMQSGLDAVRVNYKSQFDRLANDARQQAMFDKLNAYQGLNGASSSLNSGIGAAGNDANYYRSQNTGYGGLLGSLMPFLGGNKGPKAPNSAVQSAANTAVSGMYGLKRYAGTYQG